MKYKRNIFKVNFSKGRFINCKNVGLIVCNFISQMKELLSPESRVNCPKPNGHMREDNIVRESSSHSQEHTKKN